VAYQWYLTRFSYQGAISRRYTVKPVVIIPFRITDENGCQALSNVFNGLFCKGRRRSFNLFRWRSSWAFWKMVACNQDCQPGLHDGCNLWPIACNFWHFATGKVKRSPPALQKQTLKTYWQMPDSHFHLLYERYNYHWFPTVYRLEIALYENRVLNTID